MNTENKLGQEPVHPTPHYNKESGHMNGFSDGMSKRFYAACAAMQGILSGSESTIKTLAEMSNGNICDTIVAFSYELADELLKQENQ